jgi:Ca-activated chloride channel family protein
MSSLSIGPIVLLQPLWLLATLALALLAIYFRDYTPGNDWQSVMSADVFRFLGGSIQVQKTTNWLLWSASLIALCMTQPVIRQSDDETWRHSIGWIAVVDISRSMTLSDTVPTRLHAARQALGMLSSESGARPIALIIYAGDAYLIAPPAFDKSVFDEHAALLAHGVIESEGSNLARALSLASSTISDSGFVAARVFVLSDTGGINASSMAAASYLADNGHQIDVIVLGSSSTTMPESASAGYAETGTQTTAQTVAQTSVQPILAKELAKSGHGRAIFANSFGVLDYSGLSLDDHAEASSHADLQALVWKDQSPWLLLLGIPLLLIQFYREHRQ